MPELPEVSTTVQGLKDTVTSLFIKDVWSDYFVNTKSKTLTNIKNEKFFNNFKKTIIGKKIIDTERRGKNILIHLSDNITVLIHMKMTGHLLYGAYIKEKNVWKSNQEYLKDSFNQFIHLIFTLSNGKHIAFSDMRKFAKVTLFETPTKDSHIDLKNLGPEPLSDLTVEILASQLSKKPRGLIKSVLMDQTVVAGIGNIYSDEILWMSGIHPERKVSSLTKNEIKKNH